MILQRAGQNLGCRSRTLVDQYDQRHALKNISRLRLHLKHGFGGTTLGRYDDPLLEQGIGHGRGRLQDAARVAAQIEHHTVQFGCIAFQVSNRIKEIDGGGVTESVNAQITQAFCQRFCGDAFDVHLGALKRELDPALVTSETIEGNMVRTADPAMADTMIERIKKIRSDGNSVGGVIECVIRNCPPGLGEPIFDKLEAELAKAMLSIPATKGFEIGSGFPGTLLTGREHNDPYRIVDGKVRTTTNRSGGVQGGISNGEHIIFRVAFKPTATIMTSQETVTSSGENTELSGKGRHDACVLPRAVPIVEAMATLVLTDHLLRQRAIQPLITDH